jgi:hypothetical protein
LAKYYKLSNEETFSSSIYNFRVIHHLRKRKLKAADANAWNNEQLKEERNTLFETPYNASVPRGDLVSANKESGYETSILSVRPDFTRKFSLCSDQFYFIFAQMN